MNFCSPLGEQFLQESEDHIGGTVSISKLHHCLSPLFLGAVYSGGGWEVDPISCSIDSRTVGAYP
jgi:hypothetical protein